ncbi:MAG: hypothetical protein EP330_00285 [Deltaproteobacteria bacterium]|nr:MAG: hypothetical protein EP330_00285 [Deltaproteobacteria bacterium]
MSKQRKSSHSQGQRQGQSSDGASLDAELGVGNHALAEELGGMAAAVPPADDDTVLEIAFPWLEQAALALHLEPRPDAEIERMVALLERSHFDRDHKDTLLDKIEGDQAAAVAVQDALERAVGEIDEDTRSALIDTLDQAWTALSEGEPADGQWQWNEQRFSLGEGEASAADRAGTLIASLVDGLSGDQLGLELAEKGGGAAVARFCRSVVLARTFDEEEEEEGGGAVPAPEEG